MWGWYLISYSAATIGDLIFQRKGVPPGVVNLLRTAIRSADYYRAVAADDWPFDGLGDDGVANLYEPDCRVYGLRLSPGEEPLPDSPDRRLAAPFRRRPGPR
jgi:hypothetical protein